MDKASHLNHIAPQVLQKQYRKIRRPKEITHTHTNVVKKKKKTKKTENIKITNYLLKKEGKTKNIQSHQVITFQPQPEP